ncbi:MAG TPA: proline racemase family protein [Terracidiphilus sp.]|nr:proline racemase family protein [Terracidiphilus sp.]
MNASLKVELNPLLPLRISVIDSHTGGEPTRCVLALGVDLGHETLRERMEVLRQRYDGYRRAILCEPRGSDVLVGAYLLEPSDPSCVTGVIFFNNAGYLGMCGHGAIGVVATLAHMGRIQSGIHRIETPVGIVEAELRADGVIACHNVPAYRLRTQVEVTVPGYGAVRGDIAWGGNWFFLVEHTSALTIESVHTLTDFTWAIRLALVDQGITGADGAEIDHVELFGEPHDQANQSRNFVLCPGKAYDRSPCGTGTSAKMACLAADGKLKAGEIWRQEGILGTVFTGSFELDGGATTRERILPTISGSASITAESTLIFTPEDPFRMGVPA